MSDKMREQFEAWASNLEYDLNVSSAINDYSSMRTRIVWDAWQASRAALVVELPQENCDAGERLMNQVRDNLDAAGVKYNV